MKIKASGLSLVFTVIVVVFTTDFFCLAFTSKIYINIKEAVLANIKMLLEKMKNNSKFLCFVLFFFFDDMTNSGLALVLSVSLITFVAEHQPCSRNASRRHYLGWHPPVAGLPAHQPFHLLLLPWPPERSQHHP